MSEAFFEIVEFVLESEKFFFIWGTTDEGKDFLKTIILALLPFAMKKKPLIFFAQKA